MTTIIKISYPTEDQSDMLTSSPFEVEDASPAQLEEWAFEEMAMAAKAAGGKFVRSTDFGAEWEFESDQPMIDAPNWADVIILE